MASRAQSLVRRALQGSAGRAFLTLLEGLERRRSNRLVVLTYHRVEDAPGFAGQMQFLAARHAIVSASEVLEAVRGGRSLPHRAVMVTFDDAYRDFAEVAWPVLKRFDMPATLFVPTAYPDRPDRVFWWDRLVHAFECTSRVGAIDTAIGRVPMADESDRMRAFVRLRAHYRSVDVAVATREVERLARELDAPPLASTVLGWSELANLAADGVTVASHTRSHAPLHRLDEPAARAEVSRSVQDLRSRIGDVLPLFAYPGGRYSESAVEGVRTAGIELGFTTVRGTNDLGRENPLLLRRNNIGWRATSGVLRARLVQGSSYLNRWRPMPQHR